MIYFYYMINSFTLLQSNTRDFLKAISRGFDRDLNEIILSLCIIIGFPIILFVIFKIMKSAERRKLLGILKSKFEKLADQYDLTENEVDIINHISLYLKEPEKKYLLLLNKHTFDYCLEQWELHHEGQFFDGLISLREKLKFDKFSPLESPVSTYQLYGGMAVKISPAESSKEKWFSAKIAILGDRHIILESKKLLLEFQRGTKIKLALHDHRGVFLFYSEILDLNNNLLIVRHSRERVAIQRRKYYRKKLNLKVYVQNESLSEESKESSLLELSGGGASLVNPENFFKNNDDLRFYFYNKEKKLLWVNAEVVRLSKGGRVMHLRFGHMKDSVRDQIIGLLS